MNLLERQSTKHIFWNSNSFTKKSVKLELFGESSICLLRNERVSDKIGTIVNIDSCTITLDSTFT